MHEVSKLKQVQQQSTKDQSPKETEQEYQNRNQEMSQPQHQTSQESSSESERNSYESSDNRQFEGQAGSNQIQFGRGGMPLPRLPPQAFTEKGYQ